MKTSFLRELSAEDVFSITFTLGVSLTFWFSPVSKPVDYTISKCEKRSDISNEDEDTVTSANDHLSPL